MRIEDLILYFALYSIIGWVCESIWVSVGTRKLVNRGFLKGPYCPIYGIGALLILETCVPLKQYPPLVFLVAMLAASVLEYFTGWLLETLFHTRWWDYSKRRFNIKGRVCLRNAILFGLMGLVATYFADPIAERLIGDIPILWRRIVAAVFAAVFLADLVTTLISLLGLQKHLQELHATVQALQAYNEEYSWLDRKDLKGSAERLRAILEKKPLDAEQMALLGRMDALLKRRGGVARLLRAFPTQVRHDLHEELIALKDAWENELNKR